MIIYNLTCFLTSPGNNAQSGGTWKYGVLNSGLPSGWVNGDTISSPTTLNITTYTPGEYPFTYTVGSIGCSSTTTYKVVIADKAVLPTVTDKVVCVKDSILSNNTITIPVVSPDNYTWTATSNNSDVILSNTSGTGLLGNSNITLTILGKNDLTVSAISNIVLTVTLNNIPSTVTSGCITYTPANLNPCNTIIEFDITVGANISAGSGKSNILCNNALSNINLDSLFATSPIVPVGATKTYLLNNVTTITSPYTFNTTPNNQTIKRIVTQGSCSSEAISTVSISGVITAGSTYSTTVCN